MSSFLAKVAEDVATLLTAETWSEDVKATREWIYYEDLENRVGTLRVACVPLRLETEQAMRSGQYETAVVDIVVQEKPAMFSNERFDQLAYLVEEIAQFIQRQRGRTLPNVNAQSNELPTYPSDTFINQEIASQFREFASVIRTQWRQLEQ